MSDLSQQQEALCQQAFEAEAANRLSLAIELYRRALQLDLSNPTPYLFLGYVYYKQGEREAATQVFSLGADISPNLVNAWQNPVLTEDIRQRSHTADQALRSHFTDLHRATLRDFTRDHDGAQIDRIEAAIWCGTHDESFQYGSDLQRPHLFYVPDLDQRPVFDASEFPWCQALESQFEQIRQEYMEVTGDPNVSTEPYIEKGASALGEDWKPLIGTDNWLSLHLYKNDEKNDPLIARLPVTMALLREVPLLTTYGRPREVLFSKLAAGQHIPPHYGLANTDMTVHLPLLCQGDAGMRVAGQLHRWQAGRAFLFDDAFLHESWNRSAESRVNLLFGAWHPDLTDIERAAVSATFEAREAWNRSRTL